MFWEEKQVCGEGERDHVNRVHRKVGHRETYPSEILACHEKKTESDAVAGTLLKQALGKVPLPVRDPWGRHIQ